jgi:hypothetical protein
MNLAAMIARPNAEALIAPDEPRTNPGASPSAI